MFWYYVDDVFDIVVGWYVWECCWGVFEYFDVFDIVGEDLIGWCDFIDFFEGEFVVVVFVDGKFVDVEGIYYVVCWVWVVDGWIEDECICFCCCLLVVNEFVGVVCDIEWCCYVVGIF